MPYSLSNNKFVNPYNFVPVNWDSTEKNPASKGLLTGVLKCRLKTVTPIAITEKKREEKDGHGLYGLIKDDKDNPMIPGSSIRGPIRSVYEAFTDSCFITNDTKQILSKRAAMYQAGKPGILEKNDSTGEWDLYEANRFLIKMKDDEYRTFNSNSINVDHEYCRSYLLTKIGNCNEISFRYCNNNNYTKKTRYRTQSIGIIVDEISGDINKFEKTGFLCVGEVPPRDDEGQAQTNKHFESIFQKQGSEPVNTFKEDVIGDIEYLLKQYNDPAVNRNADGNKEIYPGIKKAIENGAIPVWYKKEGNDFKISLAAIGRIRFKNNMGDLLKEKKRCVCRDALCPACNLFGTAEGEGKGSHIRFTDAKAAYGNTSIIKEVLLKELGSPKPSYVPFYAMEKTNVNQGPAFSYDDDGVMLRGRKFYWHNLSEDSYRSEKKTKRNATMDLIDKDQEFKFDVYFDSITEEQLDQLKYTLTLGENQLNGKYCHKIGHGKPIGLGSVKIVIESELIRENYNVNSGKEYGNLFTDSSEVKIATDAFSGATKNEKLTNEILAILNTDSTKDIAVSYPSIDGASENSKDMNRAAFKWFMKNWDHKNDSVEQELPAITETIKHPLKTYGFGDEPRGNNNTNHYRSDDDFRNTIDFSNIDISALPKK